MPRRTVAALQIGSLPEGKQATLDLILSYEQAIRDAGAALVVMPEALLGGYPKGEIFGTRLGYRLPEGREAFARYHANAIDVPGAETEALAGLSARTGASLVLGVIERAGSSLYCTALFFEPGEGLVARHRKLMPTGTERLIWAKGDGSTLPVVDSAAAWAPPSAGRTTCRCCAPPCTPRALNCGAHRRWTSARCGNAPCATSPMRAAAS